jgi:hypothetical protein
MSEAVYDEKIAPLLLQAAKLCEEHGLPMVAFVEYAPMVTGETTVRPATRSMFMDWAQMAGRCRNNLDGLVMGIMRNAREQGVDTSASFVAGWFDKPPKT